MTFIWVTKTDFLFADSTLELKCIPWTLFKSWQSGPGWRTLKAEISYMLVTGEGIYPWSLEVTDTLGKLGSESEYVDFLIRNSIVIITKVNISVWSGVSQSAWGF